MLIFKMLFYINEKKIMGTFLIPFRETLEAALVVGLILSILKVSGGIQIGRKYVLLGVVAGIVCSVILAIVFVILFSGFEGNVEKVFKYSNIMFVFIAGGLLAHGIVEFQGAQILPTYIKPVFDLSGVLSEKEGIGSFLKAVFGYDANPSLIALVAYLLYITTMFGWLNKKSK